jgi:hypothetical protein
MKFDSNLAWKQASAAIAANREVLLALAGVFFMLPSLALALLFPPPEPPAGGDSEALMAVMSDYYVAALPFLLPTLLFRAVGTLALLILLTDPARPTVGQAMRRSLRGILPYVLAWLIIVAAIAIAGGFLLALGAASGLIALAAISIAVVVLLAIYIGIRVSLFGPVIAVEGERNPVSSLKRSWALTHGNTARIGLFYALVFVAFLFVIMVISLVAGILFSLFGSPDASRMASAVVSSGLEAIMVLYFVGIIAAVHRQLAGPTPGEAGDTFA